MSFFSSRRGSYRTSIEAACLQDMHRSVAKPVENHYIMAPMWKQDIALTNHSKLLRYEFLAGVKTPLRAWLNVKRIDLERVFTEDWLRGVMLVNLRVICENAKNPSMEHFGYGLQNEINFRNISWTWVHYTNGPLLFIILSDGISQLFISVLQFSH